MRKETEISLCGAQRALPGAILAKMLALFFFVPLSGQS